MVGTTPIPTIAPVASTGEAIDSYASSSMARADS